MIFASRAVAGQCKRYAYSIEKTYAHWAMRFVPYRNKRQPLEMCEREIGEFLIYLAENGNVANAVPATFWASCPPLRSGTARPVTKSRCHLWVRPPSNPP
jgi:hypothetical protein